MKKFITFLLLVVMVLTLAACGGGTGGGASTGPMYTVDVMELDPTVYPDDYPLMDPTDFEAAYESMKDANANMEIKNYKDVVTIFGVDGAYYENCDMDYEGTMYKYYGWYADNGRSVLMTFKADGDDLEFFAWTESGIV